MTFRDVRIFVPPVFGERQGDGIFFYQQLTYQVIALNHTLVRTQRNSDYTLRGFISPEPLQEAAEGSQNNIFLIEMTNSATNEVIAQQYIVYAALDAAIGDLVSAVVFNMLSGFPNYQQTDSWRENWLFVEGSLLWSPRIYQGQNQSINWFNFGLRLAADYHFFNFMSAELGIQLVHEWVIVSVPNNAEHRDLILEIPVALKFVIKPSDFYMLQPYAGISLNYSTMGQTKPSLFSWFTGFQIGLNAGSGMVVIDPRLSIDIQNSIVDTYPYHRYMINIGIGYKHGFFPKRAVPPDF